MNIIVAGAGKTGLTLAQQLIAEGHNITLIDTNSRVLESAVERYDAMTMCGRRGGGRAGDRHGKGGRSESSVLHDGPRH